MSAIRCCRPSAKPAPPLPRPPFRGPLGERIHREICARCWDEWLRHQILLINHFGLDPRKREARDFLYGQIRAVLFDEGEVAEIDTSLKGTIR